VAELLRREAVVGHVHVDAEDARDAVLLTGHLLASDQDPARRAGGVADAELDIEAPPRRPERLLDAVDVVRVDALAPLLVPRELCRDQSIESRQLGRAETAPLAGSSSHTPTWPLDWASLRRVSLCRSSRSLCARRAAERLTSAAER